MIGQTVLVDVPDTSCHWYVANVDNTFGDGFDWETAPWYSVEGLQDVANLHDQVLAEGHQHTVRITPKMNHHSKKSITF